MIRFRCNIECLILAVFIGIAGMFMTEEVVLIDDFENGTIGEFPSDWKGRKQLAHQFYKVQKSEKEDKGQYLSVENDKTDMFIIKTIKVDLVQYPYLNWKWRANSFPPNGKENKRKSCDVVASLNVVLKASKWKPRSIKYSWSTLLEKNTVTKSPFAIWPSRCDIIVLQSGEEQKHQWVEEKRNVLDDYLKLYKKKKMPKSMVIEAIVIMSDGDNTKSLSSADYDNIYFSRD